MNGAALGEWRKSERRRLVDARLAVAPDTLERWRQSIDNLIERAFPELHSSTLAFCWPIRNEYDARPLVERLRARGLRAALPAGLAPGQPMQFREWFPGVTLAEGPLGIPAPVDSPELRPDVLLMPMNGWDTQGYRLGYGGGYVDRTLAALVPKPLAVGVGYELGRMASIHPQPWDRPMDYLVTERGVYRRADAGLVRLDIS